ncbi:hypothetical protein TTHERM_00564010 (macronuclear) [Tetrahymena thermophila SB210]|uniref:Uncharacterized protein n=1 Tax=Tetrahymena thermophila (strain SB210) TaxID=312017 RepID=I7MGN4_TETTS|nr:hypothetical protein TTHERM_00564010 [Tetrahymena thermophila SB210]EAS01755.2 hypothetical protein TTHERM_00564010 [Tetrahymena thermophila SB210]|eukprot:XP_001022000.2 hypothetical protein TTHERM_00564010 [Tetrahymena thermophila SB210]
MQGQEFEESQSSVQFNTFEDKLNLKKWDEDEAEIRTFLNKLSTDIEQSFLQRRLDRGVKEDEIQYEFELAIKEILNKEQQIKLSLELAYVLLEKMHEQRDIFSDEYDEFMQQKEELQRDLEFKEQYCEEYSRRLQFLTEQNNNLTQEYAQLEEFNDKLKARNSELDQELIKSLHQIEQVKQNKEQDTNSKLTIIQKELDNLKNHNIQLSKDLSEAKKKVQSEQIQQQELFNQLDEMKRMNNLFLKENDSIKRQLQEAQFRLQAAQEEKEKIEVQFLQLQMVHQNKLHRKDSKESDYMESDSYIAQNNQNNTNINLEQDKNQGQFSALYGEILGQNKNQNKFGDDMFNYYSSNRDSHTEDNIKDHNIKGKTKAISKNNFGKRFSNINTLSEIQIENRNNRNYPLSNKNSSQTIIENEEKGEQEIKSKAQTFTYFKKGFSNLSKKYQEEKNYEDEEYDSSRWHKQDQVIEIERPNLNFKKNVQRLRNIDQAMKIEDQNYSSIEDISAQMDIRSLQDQKIDEILNSYEEVQFNSIKNQAQSPSKEKQILLIEDHRISEEDQEEDKVGGQNSENKEEAQPKYISSNKINKLQEFSNQKQEHAQENSGYKETLHIPQDAQVEQRNLLSINSTDNQNTQNASFQENNQQTIKQIKRMSASKGSEQNSIQKQDKIITNFQTPQLNQKASQNKDGSEILQQQSQSQNNDQNNYNSHNVYKNNHQNHYNTQPQLLQDEFSNQSKTSISGQVRKFSSRNQTHRKTKFMENMKNYKISHWGEDNEENYKLNTLITNDTMATHVKKYKHEHTRSLLIPSEISDYRSENKINQETKQTDQEYLNNIQINNPFEKIVIDGDAFLNEQPNQISTKLTQQKSNLYKAYRSGIKSASICSLPSSNLTQQRLNHDNIQRQSMQQLQNERQESQLKQFEEIQSPIQRQQNPQIRIQNEQIEEKNELQQYLSQNQFENLKSQEDDSDREDATEILEKSKLKNEIQTYDLNKMNSNNQDEYDKFCSPLLKDNELKEENMQISHIIQSIQNNKSQSINPEYENISEMLINNSRVRTKERSIDKNIFRQPLQKPQRKDTYEEFFMLTAQCVKLNSPYFDEINSVKVQPYYEEIKAQQIPYHKWSDFLKEKFEKIHQQMSQQNKLKFTYKVQIESVKQNQGPQLQICSIISQNQSPQRKK